jgi:hypothetical protein
LPKGLGSSPWWQLAKTLQAQRKVQPGKMRRTESCAVDWLRFPLLEKSELIRISASRATRVERSYRNRVGNFDFTSGYSTSNVFVAPGGSPSVRQDELVRDQLRQEFEREIFVKQGC